jgi:hypothetical protein
LVHSENFASQEIAKTAIVEWIEVGQFKSEVHHL